MKNCRRAQQVTSNTKNSVREEITEYSARKYVVDGTSNRVYCPSDRGRFSTRVAEKLIERRQDGTYKVTNTNEDTGLGAHGEEPSE